MSNQATIERAAISIADCITRAGGVRKSDQSVVFEGQQYNGTREYIEDPLASIEAYEAAVRSEYETVQTTADFDYAINDVLVCAYRIARRMDAGFARTVKRSPFHIPEERRIEVGFDDEGNMQYETVGADWTSIPGIQGGQFMIQFDRKENIVKMHIQHPRLHVVRVMVDGFIDFIRDELKNASIYRGRAITPDFRYVFIDPIDPSEIIYNQDVAMVLGPFGLGPIMYPSSMRKLEISQKVGLCLASPPGTGKSMFLQLMSFTGQQHGCTVVVAKAGGTIEDLEKAYKIARQYQVDGKPVVILFEDIEKLGSNDDSRARLLDALDGVEAKGQAIVAVFTTNFPDMLDDALLRPGRIDQLVIMQLPDLSSFEKLIRLKLEDWLADDIDWVEAFPHFDGYTQSWIVGSTESVLRAAVWRARGDVENLTVQTEDLIAAAQAYRDQYDMQQRSANREKEVPTLDKAMRNLVSTESNDVDYDQINEGVDAQIEHRVDGARVSLRTENDKAVEGNLYTK